MSYDLNLRGLLLKDLCNDQYNANISKIDCNSKPNNLICRQLFPVENLYNLHCYVKKLYNISPSYDDKHHQNSILQFLWIPSYDYPYVEATLSTAVNNIIEFDYATYNNFHRLIEDVSLLVLIFNHQEEHHIKLIQDSNKLTSLADKLLITLENELTDNSNTIAPIIAACLSYLFEYYEHRGDALTETNCLQMFRLLSNRSSYSHNSSYPDSFPRSMEVVICRLGFRRLLKYGYFYQHGLPHNELLSFLNKWWGRWQTQVKSKAIDSDMKWIVSLELSIDILTTHPGCVSFFASRNALLNEVLISILTSDDLDKVDAGLRLMLAVVNRDASIIQAMKISDVLKERINVLNHVYQNLLDMNTFPFDRQPFRDITNIDQKVSYAHAAVNTPSISCIVAVLLCKMVFLLSSLQHKENGNYSGKHMMSIISTLDQRLTSFVNLSTSSHDMYTTDVDSIKFVKSLLKSTSYLLHDDDMTHCSMNSSVASLHQSRLLSNSNVGIHHCNDMIACSCNKLDSNDLHVHASDDIKPAVDRTHDSFSTVVKVTPVEYHNNVSVNNDCTRTSSSSDFDAFFKQRCEQAAVDVSSSTLHAIIAEQRQMMHDLQHRITNMDIQALDYQAIIGNHEQARKAEKLLLEEAYLRLTEISRSYNSANADVMKLKQQCNALQSQHTQLQSNHHHHSCILNAAEKESLVWRDKHHDIMQDLSSAKKSIQACEIEVSNLSHINAEYRKIIEQQDRQIADLKTKLADEVERSSELNEQLSDIRVEHDKQRELAHMLTEKVGSYEHDIKAKDEAVALLSNHIIEYESKIKSMNDENNQYKEIIMHINKISSREKP